MSTVAQARACYYHREAIGYYEPFHQKGILIDCAYDHTVASTYAEAVCTVCGVYTPTADGKCFACVKSIPPSGHKLLAPSVRLVFDARSAIKQQPGGNLVTVVGVICPEFICYSTVSSVESDYTALTGRALAATPKPDEKAWKRFTEWVFDDANFELLFPDFPTDLVQCTFDEWNMAGGFSYAQRQLNIKAYDVLKRTQYSTHKATQFSVFKMFSKFEKLEKADFFGPLVDQLKPRAIQGCQSEAAVATGRWFRAFQHYMHSAWNGSILFSAGKNSEALSDWFNERVPGKARFFEDDFTLYDSTFSIFAHKFVMRLYEKAGMASCPWAYGIRKQQVKARGVSRHGWLYGINGTMRSGVADTCLSNSIVNALCHLYSLVVSNPLLTLRSLMDSIAMAIMGDDNLLMCDSGVGTSSLECTIRSLGFIPKLKEVGSAEELVYLNMRPYVVPTPCSRVCVTNLRAPLFDQLDRNLVHTIGVVLPHSVLAERQAHSKRFTEHRDKWINWEKEARQWATSYSFDELMHDFPDPTTLRGNTVVYAFPGSGKSTWLETLPPSVEVFDTDQFLCGPTKEMKEEAAIATALPLLNSAPKSPGNQYKFGPRIGRILSRLGFAVGDRLVGWQSYVHGTLRGFEASCKHIPVLSALVARGLWCVRHFDREYETSPEFQRSQQWNTRASVSTSAGTCTYESAARVYGVTIEAMEHLEKLIGNIQSLPCFLFSPTISALVAVDR